MPAENTKNNTGGDYGIVWVLTGWAPALPQLEYMDVEVLRETDINMSFI